MDKSREELEKEYAEATVKLEQYQHKGQRLENRIKYYQQGDCAHPGNGAKTETALFLRFLRFVGFSDVFCGALYDMPFWGKLKIG